MFESLVFAAAKILEPMSIVSLLLGMSLGAIFGLLPGLGGILSMAVALPFSYGMEPMHAMFLFAGIMSSEGFGGAIPSILLNTPGTAQNAATCLDGYPMAKRGEGGRAISIAATSCLAGSIGGVVVTLVLLPVVKPLVYSFGYPEFFWLTALGLITIAVAAKGNMIKGLAGGGIGVLISMIGYTEMFGAFRYTMGSDYLWDGISLVPFVTGLFALSELIIYASRGGSTASLVDTSQVNWSRQALQGVMDVVTRPMLTIRSAIVGALVGVVPGLGGPVASFVSYTVAMRSSKNPEEFGKGSPEGVLACETAMDAKDGGALLPTVAFGIPGSPDQAILLGGFILHGLQPGPLMIRDHMEIVYALLLGIVFAQVCLSFLGLLIAPWMARLSTVRSRIIAPFVLLLVFFGAYMGRTNIFDVGVALFAGLLGYFMRRCGFPLVTVVMGFILGPLAERAFLQSLQMSDGSYLVFVTRPISAGLALLLVAMLVLPIIKGSRNKAKRSIA
ncbi:MAG: tricarboxylic transporter [Deltaproteobacteria bacterium HGW-Deltaproteobacteria-21]|nr:MAG: tricarboxylic transporter [Deltaproteobacteria bacterium HGW-Deltaproteobacteria-21]